MAWEALLDVWTKLAIVAGALLLLFLILFIVVCIISPHCPLNRFCPCSDYSDLRKPPPVYGAIEYGSDVELATVKSLQDASRGGYWPHLQHIRESEQSDGFSDPGFSERIELRKNKSPRRTPSVKSTDSGGSGTAPPFPYSHACLGYSLTFDRHAARLNIKVKQLTGVPATGPQGVVAPYIKVRVYRSPKQFWSLRRGQVREQMLNNLDTEFTTKIQRRADDPTFNETFSIDCEYKDLAALCLRLLVCDFDRYQRHVVVGEVMTEVNKVTWSPEMEVDFCPNLQPPIEEDLGQVHVGLMYLPTSQKLNLTVLAAQGLRHDPHSKPGECYVKITLMHDGRPLKKTKTTGQTNEVSPVWNESFTLDVAMDQLEKAHLALAVLTQDDAGKRQLVGRAYVGLSFSQAAREQWEEMAHSPRKQITCWHRLMS